MTIWSSNREVMKGSLKYFVGNVTIRLVLGEVIKYNYREVLQRQFCGEVTGIKFVFSEVITI